MKTIIYSCGQGMTSKQLMAITHRADIYFPEIWATDPFPLTQQEQVELLPL